MFKLRRIFRNTPHPRPFQKSTRLQLLILSIPLFSSACIRARDRFYLLKGSVWSVCEKLWFCLLFKDNKHIGGSRLGPIKRPQRVWYITKLVISGMLIKYEHKKTSRIKKVSYTYFSVSLKIRTFETLTSLEISINCWNLGLVNI